MQVAILVALTVLALVSADYQGHGAKKVASGLLDKVTRTKTTPLHRNKRFLSVITETAEKIGKDIGDHVESGADAVGKTATDVGGHLESGAKKTADLAGDVAGGIVSGVEDAADVVGDTAENVGKTLLTGVEEATDAIVDVVDDVGDGLSDALDAVVGLYVDIQKNNPFTLGTQLMIRQSFKFADVLIKGYVDFLVPLVPPGTTMITCKIACIKSQLFGLGFFDSVTSKANWLNPIKAFKSMLGEPSPIVRPVCTDMCKLIIEKSNGLAGECFIGDSRDYKGTKATTASGRTCQAWTSQTPHNHSWTPGYGLPTNNQCRDPTRGGRPWCYTTDPDTRWEYCYQKSCGEL